MGTKITHGACSVCILLAYTLAGGLASAQDDLPEVTDDGLQKVESKRIDTLYWLPGASLAGYERIMILEPFVSFRKNWQRDQNRDRRGASRVDADDMERTRQALAAAFIEQFTRVLEEDDGYEVVDSVGEDVLLLRPAIVNLDVNAPDVMAAGRSDEFITSAGEMTLYLELYDSATSALIGRAIDRRESHIPGSIRVAGSVTNRIEGERMLRQWARILRDALDDQWSADH